MKVTYAKTFGESMRAKVARLEAEIVMMPQVECVITHHFAPGMYARKAVLKAGAVYTGAVHKTEHLIVISKGKVKIVTEKGTATYQAGDVITCMPGMKNAVYVLEETVWTNFFPTTETDPEKLVSLLTESTSAELIGGSKNLQALCCAKKELG